MTVASTLNKVTIAGNGATTSFPFSFAMPSIPVSQAVLELVVTVVSSSGVATVINFGPGSSQYQLSLNAPVAPSPTGVGGIVSYNPLGTPIPTGSSLSIQRIMPVVQSTSLQAQGTLWQTVIEGALDYLTMITQQLSAITGNIVQGPQTDPPGLNYTLPPSAQRANLALTFDGSGNVTAGAVASATVSAPMVPVVGAASLAAARTALGLGTMATEGIGAALQDDGANNARVIFVNTPVSASRAITSGDYLNKLRVTGPITLTFARANTYFPGFGLWIENLNPGGLLTIAVNAADTIENGASGAPIFLFPGDACFFSTNALAAGTWWVEFAHGSSVSPPPPGVASAVAIDVTNGALGNNTATATASFVVVTDGVNFFTVAPTGGINFSTAGVGGIDAGAIAAASWYYVWVIYSSSLQLAGWLVSLSATAPNMPSGYTAKGLVGVLRTAPATAALMGTKQRGNRIEYIPGLGQTTGLPLAISGAVGNITTPTWISQSLAALVPPNGRSYDIVLLAPSMDGVSSVMAAPSGGYGGNGSTTNPPPMMLSGSRTTGAGTGFNNPMSAVGTFVGIGPVFYAANVAGGIYIKGFDLNL